MKKSIKYILGALVSFLLGTYLFVTYYKIDNDIELNYKGKIYKIPASTLILNLNDSFGGISNPNQPVAVYKTITAAIFGEYVSSWLMGIQTNDSIFADTWFKGNTAFAKLQPGLKFHNGRAVEASDVEFSITRFLVGPKFNYATSPNFVVTRVFNKIKGYHTAISTDHSQWEPGIIAGIKVVDKQTISFEMDLKDTKFFQKLNSTGEFPLVDKNNLKGNLLDFKDAPIGAGPYKVITNDTENHFYLLEKIEGAKKDAPKYVAFVFTADDIGDIKVNYNEIEESSIHVSDAYRGSYGFVFNFKSRLGDDARFREFFNLAINRKKLAATDPLKRFEADCQFIPDFSDGDKYRVNCNNTGNQVRAKELLQELKDKYQNEFPSKLILPVRDMGLNLRDPILRVIAKEIESQFKEVGFDIEISDASHLPSVFSNRSAIEREQYPVTVYRKSIMMEDTMSNFHSYVPYGGNVLELENYASTNLHDNVLVEKYIAALKDKNHIKDFNQYFVDNNISVTFLNSFKNFYFNKNKIYDLGNQSVGSYIDVSNINLK